MSLQAYVESMERLGFSPDVILRTLARHADYVRTHGLTPYTQGAHCVGVDEQWSATKYAIECRRMVDEELHRRANP